MFFGGRLTGPGTTVVLRGHERTEASARVRLLLVEDSASDARRLSAALGELSDPAVECEQASTVAGAVGAVRRGDFDVVMLDLGLPDGMGLSGLRRVRRAAPLTAVIVRATETQEQLAADALAEGAHDYLLKGSITTGETIRRSIRVALARNRTEAAIRQLAAIVESSEDSIIALTPGGRITSWNAAAERAYGYPASQVLGRELWSLAASGGAAEALRHGLEKVRSGELVTTLESVHRRSDGTSMEVALRLAATAGPGGSPSAVIAVARDISAERTAERERARMLARLRETQRIARLGFWMLDGRTDTLTWSPEMHGMFGREALEAPLSVAEWLRYVAEDDRERIEALLRGSTGGREFAFDCRALSAEGDARSIHVIGRGDPDEPSVLLGSAQDVTELRSAELELRASRTELVEQRELLAAVIDSAPTGLAILGVSGDRFLRVNRALCRTLGYGEKDLLTQTTADVTHPEDRVRSAQASRRLLLGEINVYQTQMRLIHSNGDVIWAELSASLIRDDAGEPLYFVVQFSDISDRVRVERALQQERDHTSAILAAIGEGYALSVDGRITEVNAALCALTGYDREELVGVGQPWPFWPRLSGTWSPDRRGAPPEETIVTEMVRKDGSRFDAEINARAAHRPDGTVLGWVIAIHDVSERRRYQAELERLATHDPLTGLPNHRLFHQRLGEETAQALRHERPLSVAILDLDHFKQINDGHGHLIGDQALAAVAERLNSVVREGELLARVGGEEFAWILPEADEDGAFAAAERARAALAAAPLPIVGHVTLSAGVACRDPGDSAAHLYERADQALLLAKREGRDRTIRWEDMRVVG